MNVVKEPDSVALFPCTTYESRWNPTQPMIWYCAPDPCPVRTWKTGKSSTVPMRASSAPWTCDDENFAPGSESYQPSGRYLSNPCRIQSLSLELPTAPP